MINYPTDPRIGSINPAISSDSVLIGTTLAGDPIKLGIDAYTAYLQGSIASSAFLPPNLETVVVSRVSGNSVSISEGVFISPGGVCDVLSPIVITLSSNLSSDVPTPLAAGMLYVWSDGVSGFFGISPDICPPELSGVGRRLKPCILVDSSLSIVPFFIGTNGRYYYGIDVVGSPSGANYLGQFVGGFVSLDCSGYIPPYAVGVIVCIHAYTVQHSGGFYLKAHPRGDASSGFAFYGGYEVSAIPHFAVVEIPCSDSGIIGLSSSSVYGDVTFRPYVLGYIVGGL